MIRGFLFDENLMVWWPAAVLAYHPGLNIKKVDDPGAPPKGALDPELLEWCGIEHFAVLTDNRRSMPKHLSDFAAGGGRMPGVFVVDKHDPIILVGEALATLAEASLPWEFGNAIRYLSEFM